MSSKTAKLLLQNINLNQQNMSYMTLLYPVVTICCRVGMGGCKFHFDGLAVKWVSYHIVQPSVEF